MTSRPTLLACACALALSFAARPAEAATGTHSTKSAAKGAATQKAPPAAKDVPLPEPTPDQQKAAELVYYGDYECEFNQTLNIQADPKHLFYVDVKQGKSAWVMRPVLSSTGAMRLEDVRGEMLMVQIASKSMLLNTRTGQRLVDACVSPRQRELMEAALKTAKERAGSTGPAALLGGVVTPVDTAASATK